MKYCAPLVIALACRVGFVGDIVLADPPVTAPAPAKLPVPTGLPLADATKMISGIFADDISKAATDNQKTALSAKLLKAATEEKSDMAGKYALFQRSKDLAIEACDLDAAMKAVDSMADVYQINALQSRVDAAAGISKQPSLRRKKFATDAEALASDALIANKYDEAKSLGDLAVSAARQTKDTRLIQEVSGGSQYITAVYAAHQQVASAEATLKKDPADPDANVKLGRFRCFVKGDWQLGLPNLAAGSDQNLSSIAAAEIKGVQGDVAESHLAEDWWGVAAAERGDVKLQIQSHAAMWYRKALPSLTGINKVRIQKRLDGVDAMSDQLVAKSQRINLLKNVDLLNQAVAGTWKVEDGAIVSDDQKDTRLDFNYQPPREYDYKLEFTKISGNDAIDMVLYSAGRQFSWTMGSFTNKACGFRNVAGKNLEGNPTMAPEHIQTGHVYTCIIKVRANGLAAYLDGKLMSHLATDYADMSLYIPPMHHTDTLGVWTFGTVYSISKAEVIEIDGTGKIVSLN